MDRGYGFRAPRFARPRNDTGAAKVTPEFGRTHTRMTRSMKRFPIAAAFALGIAPAVAQTPPSVPSLGGAPAPSLAPQAATTLSLTAVFAGEQKPIRSGLIWRVYEDRSDVTQLAPIAKSSAASPSIPLKPGSYIVHVAYGFASASKRVTVVLGPRSSTG